MSAATDLQTAVAGCLRRPGSLRVPAEILCRRPHELASEVAAAAAGAGLTLEVQPVLPLRALQGVPFVFFEAAEVRVRILETTALNETGADAYDLLDDVANALQGQPQRGLQAALEARMASGENAEAALAWAEAEPALAPLVALSRVLAQPLELAQRPVEPREDPARRILDVLFTATFGFSPNPL